MSLNLSVTPAAKKRHASARRVAAGLVRACITAAALMTPGPAAFADDGQKVQVETDDAQAKVKVKENRLDKTKWEKKNYDRFISRRKEHNLPEVLNLAPFDQLRRDPTLPHADMTDFFPNEEVTSTLLATLEDLAKPIPAKLPDINILFSGSPVTNAVASSTGQIVVNAGMVQSLQYMDEVIFLLGHELSHIALDHFKDEETRQTLNTLAIMAIYAANHSDNRKSAGSKELLGALVFSEAIIGPSWKRGDEEEADELAIDMMVRAGYSTMGAESVLGKLSQQEALQEQRRKKRCAGRTGLLHFLGLASPPPPECDAIKKAFSSLFASHPTASKRKAHLIDYIATRYPAYTPPEPRKLPATMAAFFDPHGPLVRSSIAQSAVTAFEQGHDEEGIRYAIASYDPNDQRTPAPALAHYYHLKLLGKVQEARDQLRTIYKVGTASRGIYLILMAEMLQEADEIQARETAKAYKKHFEALSAKYEGKPEVAIADAKATEEARIDAQLAPNRPKDSQEDEADDDTPLAALTIQKYDETLDLIESAKARFPGRNDEFVTNEIDILSRLGRDDKLFLLVRTCANSDDKILKNKCKDTMKALEKAKK